MAGINKTKRYKYKVKTVLLWERKNFNTDYVKVKLDMLKTISQ